MKKWFYPRTDLAGIFDQYSILDVKYNNAINPTTKSEIAAELKYLENIIVKGIGLNTFRKILISPEYNALFEANLFTYNAINVAEKDVDGKDLSAHQLNNINKKRTAAKRELAMKFLGEEISEIKLGVDGNKL